jgi:hypothetical protein
MNPVASLCEARRRRAIALKLPAPELPWRTLGEGWSCRPAPDGDLLVRRGLRQRLFEACRLGRLGRPVHCPCCRKPLRQGETAYREQGPPEEMVSWREMRICARCVSEAVASATIADRKEAR